MKKRASATQAVWLLVWPDGVVDQYRAFSVKRNATASRKALLKESARPVRYVPAAAAEPAILSAARAWWRSKRPIGWTEAQHLASPTINTMTQWESRLARAVARAVKKRKK